MNTNVSITNWRQKSTTEVLKNAKKSGTSYSKVGFDTLDHHVLTERLRNCFDFRDIVLAGKN